MTGSVELHILESLLSLLTVVIGSLISAFVPKIKQSLDAHLTAKQALIANHVINGLATISEAVVQDFTQRIVQDAKTSGVFTPMLAASVKKDAVSAVMSQSHALSSLGTSTLGDVEALIGTLIEQAVSKYHIHAPGTNASSPNQIRSQTPNQNSSLCPGASSTL